MLARFPLALVAISACGAPTRSAATYRDDTQALLATRNSEVEQCYDVALAKNSDLRGIVTVHFTVHHETGALSDAVIDPASKAPAELGDCVLKAISDLKLSPGDRNDGRATFVYDFHATGVTASRAAS
jgi:uncharacterized lipoprotein